ncbi:MAG TPA: hypothetical protein VF767_12160 [Bryobacteraceae bacterium]
MSRIPTLAILGFLALAAAAQAEPLRGKLVAAEGKPPAIETETHKLVTVAGDPESLEVLGDARLAGDDIELLGKFDTPEHFTVGPFYTSKSILVHKDGKRYTVSYWCPVCSIRTYTPGKCRCCREETHLDLEELKP